MFRQKAIQEEVNIKNRQQTTIIENFLIKERGMQHVSEFNPLNGHQITDDYRIKMVDWMIEVCT